MALMSMKLQEQAAEKLILKSVLEIRPVLQLIQTFDSYLKNGRVLHEKMTE